MVNTILKEADLFCPNSVRINFTIYQTYYTGNESSVRFNSYLSNRFDDDLDSLQNDTYTLLKGGTGSWGAAYKTALLAFKKFKLQKYPSYTDSEAKDAAKAFRKLIEQNA
ncbi:hypothetical protein DTJ06_09025 [Parasaccharibacter sp. TMW 2.1886]|nr:hypothetical protein [Parasaccharibacter sp. TMW 2.1886]